MISKIFLVFLSFILSYLYTYFKSKNNKIYNFLYIILISVFVVFFSFRFYFFDNIGTDYYEYKTWFEYINFSSLPLKFSNFAFNFLICICKLICDNFLFFLFCCSLIINLCVVSFIEKNSKDFVLSILIYACLFFFSTFNVLRQWLACAVFLYSFKYIINNNFKKYLLSIIIASLFHSSAVILILLYPIFNIKIKFIKKEILVILFGIIIIFNSNSVIFSILSNSGDYLERYSSYSVGIGNYTNFFISVLTLIILNIRNLKKPFNFNDSKILIFLCIATIMNYLATKTFIFNRISIYFLPSILLALPILTQMIKKESRIIIKYILYFFLLLSFI